MTADADANAALLARPEVAGGWFAAVKVVPVWARRLEEALVVETLEGPVQAAAGDMLCRGPGGEMWPQSAASLAAKYVPSEATDAEGFRRYDPDPDGARVWACRLTVAAEVRSDFGPLHAEPGDYLLRARRARGEPQPAGLWVVAATIFEASYQVVEASA